MNSDGIIKKKRSVRHIKSSSSKRRVETMCDEIGERYFVLQWHVTARCEYSCRHCYVHDSFISEDEINNELNLDDCIKILEDFNSTLKSLGISGRIYFTGGDPLLKEGIFELIKNAGSKGIKVGILGNPDRVDEGTAQELKKAGILMYQMSIDGLEDIHDGLRRKKGSFKKTIHALEILNSVGIPTKVMFTLSKENVNELINVLRLVAMKDVSNFDFTRLVPLGAGYNLRHQMLSP
jgi:MoaA/NifB/PqqE/SkfB family radical SAM enzyme